MISRFDDLWASAAGDGASCPIGASHDPDQGETDVDELLDAWQRERAGRIECSLMLDEARRLIGRLMATGSPSPKVRRRASHLLRAIRDTQRGDEGLGDHDF